MPDKNQRTGRLWKAFIITLYIKGIDGALETIGGILLFFLNKREMSSFIRFLTQHEIFGFHHNWLANKAWELLNKETVKLQLFQAIYLLLHGLLKLILVWGLLKKILPLYIASMIILAGFIAYEIFHWTHTHSIALLFFMFLDMLILALVIKEYMELRNQKPEGIKQPVAKPQT
jgi:uncharacterized membrane protein